MDGYSDQPFRSMCRRLGSAMSYTEFIGALEILNEHPRIGQKLAFSPEERPLVYQIFDNDPDRLLEVALRLQDQGPDIIDINLGCSSKSVSSRGAGAGLRRRNYACGVEAVGIPGVYRDDGNESAIGATSRFPTFRPGGQRC